MNKKLKSDLDIRFLSSLVSPLSRTPLRLSLDKKELISEAAAMAFPVRNGIPILLLDEARKFD